MRYSIRQYLAKLEKSEKSQTRLLTSALNELRRDEEAQNSIILTWQISFDHIRTTRPSAVDLLSLMSMYKYQGIPEYLVKAEIHDTRAGARLRSSLCGVEQDSDASSSSSPSDDEDSEADNFEDDVLMLENFYFISTMLSGTGFQMHRVIQLAARVWLRSKDLYQDWACKRIERLDQTLPNGEHVNWERCRELYPHVTSTVQLDEKEHSLARASIQYKAAWFDWRRGLWSNAEALITKSYKIRTKVLGQEDQRTLCASSILASVLRYQGKYEAAEEVDRQVLEVREKVLGKEHPDTLNSVWCLADLMEQLERKCDALSLYERAVTGLSTSLGAQHPHTIQFQGSLNRIQSQY